MVQLDSYQQLRSATDEELIAQYDHLAPNTLLGVSFLLDELVRRQAERQSANMERMTRQMLWLTIIVTILTVINVVVFIATV